MGRYKIVRSRQSQVDGGRLIERVDDTYVVLPPATADIRGGIRVGDRLSIQGDILSADDQTYDDSGLQLLTADLSDAVESNADRIEALETAAGPDLSGYATVAALDAVVDRVDELETATPTVAVVEHGTNASAARPAAEVVLWYGSGEPTNAQPNDQWYGGGA